MSKLPPVMMRPSLLPTGQPWVLRCPFCVLDAQGGVPGLLSHVELVHPEEGQEAVRRLCQPHPENDDTPIRAYCQPPEEDLP